MNTVSWVLWAVVCGAGLWLLLKGAALLLNGARALAIKLGIPSVVVGLTVVALGTSAPELFVSALSSVQGQADIAVGNVVGSNIVNLLVILALPALVIPLSMSARLLRFDVWVMLASAILAAALSIDGTLSRFDGLLLLVGWGVYLRVCIKRQGHTTSEPEDAVPMNSGMIARSIGLGLTALVIGSQLALTSSVAIARQFGLSELFIGLTLVALGTSLPELATSFEAARRGDHDMSIANAVGSNTLNILTILGLSSVVAPHGLEVSQDARLFDLPVMIAVSALTVCLAWRHGGFTWASGSTMLLGYLLYVTSLLLDWNDPVQWRVLAAAATGFAALVTILIVRGPKVCIHAHDEASQNAQAA